MELPRVVCLRACACPHRNPALCFTGREGSNDEASPSCSDDDCPHERGRSQVGLPGDVDGLPVLTPYPLVAFGVIADIGERVSRQAPIENEVTP